MKVCGVGNYRNGPNGANGRNGRPFGMGNNRIGPDRTGVGNAPDQTVSNQIGVGNIPDRTGSIGSGSATPPINGR